MKAKRSKAASAKKKAAPKKSAKKRSPKLILKNKARKKDLRAFKRFPLSGLWITEQSDGYLYTFEASNISEGGVFLKGCLKGNGPIATLSMNLGQKISIEAKPVHDRVGTPRTENETGTGYEFASLTREQHKLLRGFLRNLN